MNIRHIFNSAYGIVIMVGIYIFISCSSCTRQKKNEKSESIFPQNVKRIGMVIKIDSSRIEEYLALHAESNPGVRDLLLKYNMRNFSIFITRLNDGDYYEFGYYEYTGNNYEVDMAALDAEPRNKEWLKICDPLQIPLDGETSWKKMKQIYFNK